MKTSIATISISGNLPEKLEVIADAGLILGSFHTLSREVDPETIRCISGDEISLLNSPVRR